MDPDIMAQVSGVKHWSQKAVLHEYIRKTVIGEVYPAIIMQEGGSAVCEGGVNVAAEAYVVTASAVHQLSTEDWSYERFLEKDKWFFQGDYSGYGKLG